MLDTVDEDSDWLLGGAYQLEMQDFSKSKTESPHRHRVKSVGLGTRMVFKPGMDLAVSVQAWENPAGSLIGLGAGPVDLKFAPLNTNVRLKYRCFATISGNIIPDLVGLWNISMFSSQM